MKLRVTPLSVEQDSHQPLLHLEGASICLPASEQAIVDLTLVLSSLVLFENRNCHLLGVARLAAHKIEFVFS